MCFDRRAITRSGKPPFFTIYQWYWFHLFLLSMNPTHSWRPHFFFSTSEQLLCKAWAASVTGYQGDCSVLELLFATTPMCSPSPLGYLAWDRREMTGEEGSNKGQTEGVSFTLRCLLSWLIGVWSLRPWLAPLLLSLYSRHIMVFLASIFTIATMSELTSFCIWLECATICGWQDVIHTTCAGKCGRLFERLLELSAANIDPKTRDFPYLCIHPTSISFNLAEPSQAM